MEKTRGRGQNGTRRMESKEAKGYTSLGLWTDFNSVYEGHIGDKDIHSLARGSCEGKFTHAYCCKEA